MSTIIYINHRTKGRIPVAEVRGDVLHKSIYDASWLMQKPPGIAFDSSSLADAEQAGAVEEVLAIAGIELAEQVLQVPLHRLVANAQRQRNLLVGEVAGKKMQHLPLLGGQECARKDVGINWQARFRDGPLFLRPA